MAEKQKKTTTTTTTVDEGVSKTKNEKGLNEATQEAREEGLEGNEHIAQAQADAFANANRDEGELNPNNYRGNSPKLGDTDQE